MTARFLVTGGAGFIGRALCARLAEAGAALTVLDDLSTGREDGLPRGTRLIRADIRDRAALEAALEEASGVFHLAAVSSVVACQRAPATTRAVNLGGIKALLARCGAVPVVYTSTAAVYGEQDILPIPETATPAPISPYARQKLAGERALIEAAARGGRGVCLRLFNVYGPGQSLDAPYAGVITRFLTAALAGAALRIDGGGTQVRDLVHIDDVTGALMAAMDVARAGASGLSLTLNICSGRPVTVLDLARSAMTATGREVPLRHDARRAGDIARSLGDPALAREVLRFAAGTRLEEGMADLARHLAGHGRRASSG